MIERFNSMTEGMSLQARNALRVHLIGFPAAVLTAVVYLIMALQYGAWQLYAWSADIWVLALAVFAGIRYIRRGHVASGIWLLLTALQVTFIVAVALIDGTGLIIGASITILVAIIAGQTLSSRQANVAILLGITSGIAAVFIELFSSFPRYPQPPLIRTYLPGILISVIVLFSYVTVQQFRNYLLRTKLIIIFNLIVLGSIGAVAFLSSATLKNSLTDGIGTQLNTLANSKATEIGQALDREADILKALSYNQLVQDLVTESNEQGAFTKQEIDQFDAQWQASSAQNNNTDPLVSSVIFNALSDEFRQFQEDFPQHIEIFLTDRQGINVAATNITSDYYQADEEWWQVAKQDGLYIGQPEYDKSADAIAIIIAVRVKLPDNERSIGILRTTVALETLTDSLASGLFGETGHTDIYLPDGQEIEFEVKEDGTYKTELVDAELDINILTRSSEKYLEIVHDDTPTLASQALVNVLGDAEEDIAAISTLNWRVVVLQDQSEAFQAIDAQIRNLILLAIAISLAVAFIAIGMAQVITAPITRLNTVANEIASGEFAVRAQAETDDEVGTLAATFNKMAVQINELIATLEHRVAERTMDLESAKALSENRAQELHAISEISRTIATEQRMDVLLPLVTRLVSERFDFYHVGIFFVDNSRQFAVLQTSNSEGGKRMIERGHRLEMNVGIVGNVADTGRPRIALDVGSDAVFFNNPDLPGTRSEMALPLNVRGQTIGVLDVQSTKPGAFSESDANNLGILADQVAIAIDNARLFGQSQDALNQVQKLIRQYQSQEWVEFIRQSPHIGYRQGRIVGKPFETPVENETIREALGTGKAVVLDEAGGHDSQPVMAIPVKLRGQTIGVLNVQASASKRNWSPEEINLAQAISDRLALALENARLLQESQRRAAKEQKIGEVTARIGASINMRNVLQTAVEELGKALPGSEVVIQFQQAKEN